MVDETSTVTLKGVDDTKDAVDSATRNVQGYIKELEKALHLNESQAKALQSRASQTNRSYKGLLETILQNNKAYNDQLKVRRLLAQAGTEDADKQSKALKAVSGELIGMIGRYASVTAAIEAARRSFVAFAEAETKMIKLSNATGMTEKAAEGAINKMRELSAITATSADDSYGAMTKLREGLKISNDEALKMLPRVQVVAKGMETSATSTAKLLTSYMRNMDIPLKEYGAALEIISGGAKEANINMQDLTSNGSQLIEMAKSMGYTGTEGIAKVQALLGSSVELMDDTSKGARTMMSTMQMMKSESFGEMMGIPGKMWREQIDAAPDAIAFAVKSFKAQSNQKDILAKMDRNSALLLKKWADEDDGRMDRKIEKYKQMARGTEAVAAGTKMITGAEGGMAQMTETVKNLATEFGNLMNTLKVPDIIRMFTKELERMGSVVKALDSFFTHLGKGEFKKAAGSLVGPHFEENWKDGFWKGGPTIGSVTTGVRRGMTGEGSKEEQAKRIAEELAKGDAGVGAGSVPPQRIPLPPNQQPAAQPMRFMSGDAGGDAADDGQGATEWDSSNFTASGSDVWKQMRRSTNIEDRREYDPTMQPRGFADEARDALLKKAIPGSKVLTTIKADAQPGPNQHALRSRLRGMLGIEDPKEDAPWVHANRPLRFASALGGLTGQGAQSSDQKYGSSTDAKYLTAAYHPSGAGGGGGGGGGGVGGGEFSTQAAGPGAYGGGGGYGGQTQIPTAQQGVVPANMPPVGEVNSQGVPVQPGTSAPVLPPELGGPQPGAVGAQPRAETGSQAVANAQGTGGLAADRAKFKAEMDANPALREKVLRIAANEQGKNAQGTQAVIETMMNRASHRGRTLAQEATWHDKQTKKGYYEQGNKGVGALEDPAHKKVLEASLDKALGGSNITDYATDNASQALAAKRKANNEMEWKKDYGGESFFAPGRVSGVGNVKTHAEWVERMRKGDVGQTTQVASTDPTSGIPPTPPPGTGGNSGVTLPAGTTAGGGASGKEKWEQQGIMTMEGKEYRYGSGGGGKGATPAGSYNINMDKRLGIGGEGGKGDLGPVGKRIGSIATVGGRGGEINRGRAGIQIHSAMTQRLNKLYTAGCFGIDPKQWPAYREHLLDMAKRNPQGLRIDVGEDGRAQVVVRGTPLPMPGDKALGKTQAAQAISGSGDLAVVKENQPTPSKGTGWVPDTTTPTPNQESAAEPKGEGATQQSALDTKSEPAGASGSDSSGGGGGGGRGGGGDREENVNVKLKVNDNDVQFARTSMRRSADREVREARWNSYSDIGAA